MTVRDVENAISNVRATRSEWDEIGLNSWLEMQTRYAIIDPLIKSLGWDLTDPKQCYPEYPRPLGNGRVDYAFFDNPNLTRLGNAGIAPLFLLESKSLGTNLDSHFEQFRNYVEASPRMRRRMAVFTNGEEWEIYRTTQTGVLPENPIEEVNIFTGSQHTAARILNQWLRRGAVA